MPVGLAQAIAESDVVVVGTVTATRSRDRIATVAVEETWKGDVAPTFEVYGGPDKDNTATTVDRTYITGTRYLLFAYEPAAHGSPATFGGRYEDNSCTNTRPWTESLASLRPATATVTERAPDTTPSSPPTTHPAGPRDSSRRWLLASALAVGAFVVAILAATRLRRRRSPASA